MTLLNWQKIQQNNFTSTEKLVEYLELDETKQKQILSSSLFTLNLPLRLAEKIEKNSLDDPIFRQFIPLQDELTTNEAFSKDPTSTLLKNFW